MAGNLSQHAAEKVLNAILNAAALGNPATWYVGGLTTLPDANGENYVESAESRQSVTANSTNFPAWAAGEIQNGTAITFSSFSGDETWLGVGFFDAATDGNLWLWVEYDASKAVLTGESLTMAVGSLTFSLAQCTSGGLDQSTCAAAILNSLLNAAAFSPAATWYVGLFTTNPDANGENYVESAEDRISKTANSTNFPAWASGVIRNGTDIDYPAFSGTETLTGCGIFDDATAGNLWLWSDFTADREVAATATFSIPANGLTFAMGVCPA